MQDNLPKCYYLPVPPRAWSRVQNDYSYVTSEYLNAQTMLNKGNVLQYKANSSNITKTQRYSKIVRREWSGRKTIWASQSLRGYTNPNTSYLKRNGNTNIAIDPITGQILGETNLPITCPQNSEIVNETLPANSGGGSSINEPVIPPPVEPSSGSDTFPPTVTEELAEPIVIPDGGSLICSVQENICTGETKTTVRSPSCYPTTDSNVPGQIQDLCWKDGINSWYPRQRYFMTNSSTKWPTNAKLTSALHFK
jgi:hypothetical protein